MGEGASSEPRTWTLWVCACGDIFTQPEPSHPSTGHITEAVRVVEQQPGTEGEPFKFAGFSGPHPTLAVDCPTCGAPAGHYCNAASEGQPRDRPHDARRKLAGTSSESPEHQPDVEAEAQVSRWNRMVDLIREEQQRRTVAAVVEALRERAEFYRMEDAPITARAYEMAAEHIESDPRFKADGTGGHRDV